MGKLKREEARFKRHKRIRKKIFGSSERPRLCVYRSLKHIYAQIVDDTKGQTLAAFSSQNSEFKVKGVGGGSKEGAKIVGEFLAERALKENIKKVVFDRGGCLYHGRVKALAEGVRTGGLEF